MTPRSSYYYHILIETTDKTGPGSYKDPITACDIDDLEYLKVNYIYPYLRHNLFKCDGYKLEFNKIKRIKIIMTNLSLNEINKTISQNPERLFTYSNKDLFSSDYARDITNEILNDAEKYLNLPQTGIVNKNMNAGNNSKSRRVFIIHVHDERLKLKVKDCLRKFNLEPLILSDQADNGNTLLEKIEQNSDVAFAIALYTPCDEGRKKDTDILRNRARQNVVFEHGMLIGKLGRENVCAIVDGEIEIPSDLNGQVYIKYSDSNWEIQLVRNIKSSGIEVDLNKLV